MGIIGYNVIGATAENIDNTDRDSLTDHATYVYVAPAGEEVFKLWFYVGATYTGDSSGVDVGVYDITGGTNGASLVASGNIPSMSLSSWNSVEITPVALTEGNTYAAALRVVSATTVRAQNLYSAGSSSLSTSTGSSALVATWDDASSTGVMRSFYAETQAAATPSRSITNIDADNDVQPGQSTSVTGVGFDLPIVSVTLDGESVTVTGTPTDTNIDVTIPLHINAEWGSATNDLVVTDQTGALTLNNVTLSAPTGWETVTFTTAPDAGTTESFYELSQTDATVGNFTAATNDILAFESQTGLTVDGQTIPVVDPPSTVSGAYKWWDASLSTWTSASSFTINDLGFFGSSSNIILRDVLKPILSNVLSNILEE